MVGQKTFDTIFEWYRFGSWVLRKHPEIYLEYFHRPFEHLCPQCKNELVNVNPNPQYWFCTNCIKGYTNEELNLNAEVQEEDNAVNGIQRVQ